MLRVKASAKTDAPIAEKMEEEKRVMSDYSKIFSPALAQKAPDLSALLEHSGDKVGALEELVKQLLAAQHQVAGSVTERITAVPGLPKPMAEMTEQMHEVADAILKLQAEVWSGWFGILRQLQGAASVRETSFTVAKVAKPPVVPPVVIAPAAEQAELPTQPDPVAASAEPPTAPTPEMAPERAAISALAVDDLKVINGVGPAIEKRLNEAGVFNYQQIANWSDEDIDRIEAAVMSGRFVGRIRRDDWVGQAKSLLGSSAGASA